jgi:hypothetical protein
MGKSLPENNFTKAKLSARIMGSGERKKNGGKEGDKQVAERARRSKPSL